MAKKAVAEVRVDALRPRECNESMGWWGTPSTAAPRRSVGGPSLMDSGAMPVVASVFRRANDPRLCSSPARNRPETVNEVPKERNAMNRCEQLGKTDDNKMMAPLGNHHLHFCGIHCAKKDPRIQIITQHYCGMVGKDMHQCLLYDSVGKNARLLGVEYIISDETFRKLPDVEKRYWHPHTYEVLGGGLIAPGMKPDDEMAFMKGLLLTWGKTWHTWPDPTTPVPMGEPMLMWSLTGEGQDDPKVIAARDKEFGVKTADIPKKRIEAIGYEVPAVPQPKDMDVIGRQWTATGEDKPTPTKK